MRRVSFILLVAAAAAALLAVPALGAPRVGFGQPLYVSNTLAGGEPLILADPIHHTIVYSSHEGTTHLYRPGLTAPIDLGVNYRNQVNIWTSKTGGRSWVRNDYAGTGSSTDPTRNSGFSDPALTQDEGGRIYNTGINLANDSLFSSGDGGLNWDRGTAQCHDGDRPWLAGAKRDQVYLANEPAESSHTIFESKDGGNTCSQNGPTDNGTLPDGTSYAGYGKLYYDHQRGMVAEPEILSKNGTTTGIGVGTWTPGDAKFTPHKVADTSIFAHFPIVSIDAADNLYVIWDTDERIKGTTGGCGPVLGAEEGTAALGENKENPSPNSIKLAVSKDFGKSFSAPTTIAAPPNTRVLWPWAAAGEAGRLSIVYYQLDKVADSDCQQAKVSVREAHITGADNASTRSVTIVDPIGRPIHDGTVCQGGTTCVATGQDRRLGDFLSNSIDDYGCVMIGTGDTTRPDPTTGGPRPISLPLFVRQTSGESLTGADCAAVLRFEAGTGPPPHPSLTVAAGGVTASCSDRVRPVSRFARRGVLVTHRRTAFRGRSSDRGCRNAGTGYAVPGKVARVDFSISKVRRLANGRHVCRFARANA
ncbi:MAG: hypothetical protein QOE08_1961, partial [Thermoleophilaceae bacterium]|nr:hypothetical protein [Thermoleophilaceae bacterium]